MTTLPQALHDARIGCHPCDHEADAERLHDALKPLTLIPTALVEAAVAWAHTPGWSTDRDIRAKCDADLGLAVAAYLKEATDD